MDCGGNFYADHDTMDLFSIREYIGQHNIFSCKSSRDRVFTNCYFSSPQICSYELLARNCDPPNYSFVYCGIPVLHHLYVFIILSVKEDQMRAIIGWFIFYFEKVKKTFSIDISNNDLPKEQRWLGLMSVLMVFAE